MFYFPYTRKPDFKNIHSLEYDTYWQTRGLELPDTLNEREEIIFTLIKPQTKVIDIGCGISYLPIKLLEKNCDVTVADISDTVLDKFRRFSMKVARLDLEKINEVPFADHYDYAILSEVLEHTSNPEEIIDCFKEKTTRFIFTIPNSAYFRYRLHLFFCGRFFTQWVYHPSEHLRFWSHTDFLDWIADRGLHVDYSVASNGFSFRGLFPNLKDLLPNLFGHQIVYLCRVL